MLKIKKVRNEQKMTLDELALKSGVSKRMISSYEANENDITLKKLQNIAEALKVNILELTDIELPVKSPPERSVPFWNLAVSAGKSMMKFIGKTPPDGYICGLPGTELAEIALLVLGASPDCEISNGAIVGLHKVRNWDSMNAERIYLIITRDDSMISRIEHDENNPDILWCLNSNSAKFKIHKANIIEIHRICFVYYPK